MDRKARFLWQIFYIFPNGLMFDFWSFRRKIFKSWKHMVSPQGVLRNMTTPPSHFLILGDSGWRTSEWPFLPARALFPCPRIPQNALVSNARSRFFHEKSRKSKKIKVGFYSEILEKLQKTSKNYKSCFFVKKPCRRMFWAGKSLFSGNMKKCSCR